MKQNAYWFASSVIENSIISKNNKETTKTRH